MMIGCRNNDRELTMFITFKYIIMMRMISTIVMIRIHVINICTILISIKSDTDGGAVALLLMVMVIVIGMIILVTMFAVITTYLFTCIRNWKLCSHGVEHNMWSSTAIEHVECLQMLEYISI